MLADGLYVRAQLNAFIALVQVDSSLQARLRVDGSDSIAIAKTAGFIISQDDLCCSSKGICLGGGWSICKQNARLQVGSKAVVASPALYQ